MLGQIHYRRHLWGSPLEGNHIRSEALLKISLGVTLGGESYWVDALLKTSLGVTVGGDHIGSMRY